MDDTTLLALCLWDEAAGEPLAGQQAVARVILNRMSQHYDSDGTLAGTVLAKDQFSGFWFAMTAGHYARVCWTRAGAEARAEHLLETAEPEPIWADCVAVAQAALAGQLPDAPLLDRALLYLNPAIVHPLPAWASPDKALCAVGRHTFYQA